RDSTGTSLRDHQFSFTFGGAHLREELLDARRHLPEERVRMDADPDDEDEERREREELVPCDVRDVAILFVRDRTEEDALNEPQQIDCGENDAGRGERSEEHT